MELSTFTVGVLTLKTFFGALTILQVFTASKVVGLNLAHAIPHCIW